MHVCKQSVGVQPPQHACIAGFRSEVDGNCSLLGCYAASSGNFLPTFRDNVSFPSSGFRNPKCSRTQPEDITPNRLSRNVCVIIQKSAVLAPVPVRVRTADGFNNETCTHLCVRLSQ